MYLSAVSIKKNSCFLIMALGMKSMLKFCIRKNEINMRVLLSNCTSQSTNNAQNEYKYHAVFVLQRTG